MKNRYVVKVEAPLHDPLYVETGVGLIRERDLATPYSTKQLAEFVANNVRANAKQFGLELYAVRMEVR